MSASHPSILQMPGARPQGGRHLGLDGLRGIASLMVAALHAAVPYLLWPMPLLLWSARDPRPSPLVDAIGWGIQCCVMPTFFVLSGYFAAGLMTKLSPGEFFRHRQKRLLVPLVFGFSAILPLCLYAWITGWVADGLVPPRKLLTLKFSPEIEEHLWGFAHLWFLEYLFIASAALAGAAAWIGHHPGGRLAAFCSWTTTLPTAVVTGALALASAGVLWCDLAIVVGFQNTLAPVLTKLAYFSLYFLYGLWLRERLQQRPTQALGTGGWVRWLAAAAAFAYLLPLIHAQQQLELAGAPRVALAGLLALYAWLMADSLVRAARDWRPQADSLLGRTLTYLAQASLWMYLAHLPVVALLQVDLATAPLPAAAKFAIVTLASWGTVLLFYQAAVRHTWVGALLEGRPQPVASDLPTGEAREPAAHLAAAADGAASARPRKAA